MHPKRPLVLLLCALAGATPAGAAVSGSVGATGNAVLTSEGRAATLLQETLTLQYAGLPLGEHALFLGGSGTFTNVDSAFGAQSSGSQTLNASLNLGFLPRRTQPLRLYGRGGVMNPRGSLFGRGALPVGLGYGAALTLPVLGVLPRVFVQYDETRESGSTREEWFQSLRRSLSLDSSRDLGKHSLSLGLRLENSQGLVTSSGLSLNGNLAWSSPSQRSILSAATARFGEAERLNQATSLSLAHTNNPSRWLSTSVSAQRNQTQLLGAEGTAHSATGSFILRPLRSSKNLSISANGDWGNTQSKSEGAQGQLNRYGGTGAVSYAHTLGFMSGSASAHGGYNAVDSRQGASGAERTAGASVGLSSGFDWASAGLSYGFNRVLADAARGGNRTDQQLAGSARVQLAQRTTVSANGSYTDARQVLLDLQSGRAVSLRQRTAALGASFERNFTRMSLTAGLNYSAGTVLNTSLGQGFTGPVPSETRGQTSAAARLNWVPGYGFVLGARMNGSLSDSPGGDVQTLNANLMADYSFGLISVRADYTLSTSGIGGLSPPVHQGSLSVSRPFAF